MAREVQINGGICTLAKIDGCYIKYASFQLHIRIFKNEKHIRFHLKTFLLGFM